MGSLESPVLVGPGIPRYVETGNAERLSSRQAPAKQSRQVSGVATIEANRLDPTRVLARGHRGRRARIR